MNTGVVVAIRNRESLRLVRFLKTLSAQTCPPTEVVVINYGDPCPEIENIPTPFRYVVRHFPQPTLWCRGLSLNQGFLLLEKSDAVLFTDIDLLFEANFIECGHRFFEDFGDGILICQCLDLPPEALREDTDVVREYENLKSLGIPRDPHHVGGCMWLANRHVTTLRGHDEEYMLWHCQDGDFVRRAMWLELPAHQIHPETSFLHQWHPTPKFGAADPSGGELYTHWATKNRERLDRRHEAWKQGNFIPSDVNPSGWGKPINSR